MAFFESYETDFCCIYDPPAIYPIFPGMHVHPQYQILINLLDCETSSFINGNNISLNTPFLAIFSPFCMHQTNFTREKLIDKTSIYISEGMIADYSPFLKGEGIHHAGSHVFYKLSDELVELIRPIHDIMIKRNDSPDTQMLLFLIIMNTVLEKVPKEDIIYSSSSTFYISEILKYMVEHLAEPITLDSISKQFFISRSKLASNFKKYTGQTVHQFLIKLRVNRAAYIMRSRQYTNIQDVANQVGMGNGYNFYPVFKKLRGVTPLQYQKKCRENPRKWTAYSHGNGRTPESNFQIPEEHT